MGDIGNSVQIAVKDSMSNSVRQTGVAKLLFAARWPFLLVAYCIFFGLYFSSIFVHHQVLAFADGILYYYPNFLDHFGNIWSDKTFSGYPIIGDLQAQSFYLPRLLIPNYNCFVISCYVVTAVGMFGLVRKLTGSLPAGIVASIVAANGGFMMAHLGHVSIVHAASWGPLILWSLASVRDDKGSIWIVIGAFAVSLCMLGGHPQPSIYCLLLAVAYAAHEAASIWHSATGKQARAFLVRAAAIFGIGGLLSAVSLLPFIDTVSQGIRENWTLADFNSYSLDWHTLILIFFPYYFGGSDLSGLPYLGPWNLTELTVYVGVLPILLGLSAVSVRRVDRGQWFWVGAAIVAMLLTFGAYTPLGKLVAELPVLGRFRCQARFGVIVLFATAVLSGYGVAALLGSPMPSRKRSIVQLIGLFCLAVAASVVAWDYPKFAAYASTVGVAMPSFWSNPAILIPLSIFVVAWLAWVLLSTKPGVASIAFAIVVLLLDLGSFGYFYEWRQASPKADLFKVDGDAKLAVERMASMPGRVLPTAKVSQMSLSPFEPNFNSVFSLSSAVGYGPLISERRAAFAGMDSIGGLATYSANAPLLDVLGVRWFVVQRQGAPLALGECNAAGGQRSARALIPEGHEQDQLRIVSNLGCSTSMPDGATVASVQFFDKSRHALGVPIPALRAGINTSEWAYDRADVRSSVRHRRAHVFGSFKAPGADGLWYDASVANATEGSAAAVEFALDPALSASLSIKSIDAIAPNGHSIPLTLLPAASEFHEPLDIPGLPYVLERKGFKALVWQLCKARGIDREGLAATLKGERAVFNVFDEALIEDGVDVPKLDCRISGQPEVLERAPGVWKVRVEANGNSLLAISESYDAGWQASVDGVAQKISPLDGLILGVEVGPGQHLVELKFMPRNLLIGSALSGFALFVCLCLLGINVFHARRANLRNGVYG